MINKKNISEILKKYKGKISIGVLGGHSALDVCAGAKKFGFKTVVVAQKGREKTFTEYYRTRGKKGCVDEVILVDKFEDILNPSVQEKLRKLNTIFIHNRYFWVYFKDFSKIEKEFKVPIFGLRQGVKLEERDQPLNQYHLLQKAGIRMPKIIKASEIGKHFKEKGGPIIVKVNEAARGYERAFFIATSEKDYKSISEKMIRDGKITVAALGRAVIEEFVIGAQVNLNFFYSTLTKELELMGTDSRRQTSLDGFLRLDANTQMILMDHGYKPSMIETGHYAVTMKESLVEKAYAIGEKFVATMKKEVPPGIIGPFALQGAVAAFEGKEEFVIFDVSMRIPGSPGTKFTPYSGYLYGDSISYGERIAMEIKQAAKSKKLGEILT
jgi:5-formaminoimidazole-4-carboxamide-1-(beta)-D-ribofuranosyl 5'-monophosphate synthetase